MPNIKEMVEYRHQNHDRVQNYVVAMGHLICLNDGGVKLLVRDVQPIVSFSQIETVAILLAMGFALRPAVASRIHTQVAIHRLGE